MMGRSHLLLGAAGYLTVQAAVPGLLSSHAPTTAQLFAGTLVCSGFAMLPDLDHPQATVSKSLGPVTEAASKVVHRLAGGHRNGTHTVWAWLIVGLLVSALLHGTHAPWVALVITIFASSLLLRVLTESSGLICFMLAAVLGGAAVLATGDSYGWITGAAFIGYGLHLLGDIVTTEGIPPFYPLGHRVALPLIGTTDHWRERGAGIACGFVAFYLMVVMVFLPGWSAQASTHTPAPTAVSAPAAPQSTHVSASARKLLSSLTSEVSSLRHEVSTLKQKAEHPLPPWPTILP